jgi:cell division protease FtsH
MIADAIRVANVSRAIFPLIVVVLLVYLASQTLLPTSDEDRIAYSDLIARVENSPDSIADVVFVPRTRAIRVTLADGSKLESNYPTDASQLEFQQRLESNDVHFDAKASGNTAWWSIFTYLLPFGLFVAFWMFLMRRVQAGNNGKDKAGTGVD